MASQDENMANQENENDTDPNMSNAASTARIPRPKPVRMQRPNNYGVGDIRYRENENLSRPEIKKIGPVLLKEQKHFCRNDCSGASADAVHFSLKCLTDIIRFQKYLKLNVKQRKTLKRLLNPYRKQVLDLSDSKKRKSLVKRLSNQKGSGIFTSLLAAVIPLISSLVRRLLTNRKK